MFVYWVATNFYFCLFLHATDEIPVCRGWERKNNYSGKPRLKIWMKKAPSSNSCIIQEKHQLNILTGVKCLAFLAVIFKIWVSHIKNFFLFRQVQTVKFEWFIKNFFSEENFFLKKSVHLDIFFWSFYLCLRWWMTF